MQVSDEEFVKLHTVSIVDLSGELSSNYSRDITCTCGWHGAVWKTQPNPDQAANQLKAAHLEARRDAPF